MDKNVLFSNSPGRLYTTEARKEEFKRYLEENGVQDALISVKTILKALPVQPINVREFIVEFIENGGKRLVETSCLQSEVCHKLQQVQSEYDVMKHLQKHIHLMNDSLNPKPNKSTDNGPIVKAIKAKKYDIINRYFNDVETCKSTTLPMPASSTTSFKDEMAQEWEDKEVQDKEYVSSVRVYVSKVNSRPLSPKRRSSIYVPPTWLRTSCAEDNVTAWFETNNDVNHGPVPVSIQVSTQSLEPNDPCIPNVPRKLQPHPFCEPIPDQMSDADDDIEEIPEKHEIAIETVIPAVKKTNFYLPWGEPSFQGFGVANPSVLKPKSKYHFEYIDSNTGFQN